MLRLKLDLVSEKVLFFEVFFIRIHFCWSEQITPKILRHFESQAWVYYLLGNLPDLFTRFNLEKLKREADLSSQRSRKYTSCWTSTHWGQDKMAAIFQTTFSNVWISIKISLEFVLMVPINNIPSLVQLVAWHWSGDKPLSEPMMVSLLTNICVTRPQWVKNLIRETVPPLWWVPAFIAANNDHIHQSIKFIAFLFTSRDWQLPPWGVFITHCGLVMRYKSGSTLAQVMACCLMATNHYLNQCWFIIKGVLRDYILIIITTTSPSCQWAKLQELGPILVAVFAWQLKFNGNFVLLLCKF